MLSTESRRGRRILARLDRGTDLFDGVRALCQKHRIRCGELRGIGSLELAELAAFDQDGRRWKPSRLIAGGGLELLHLHGNISEESGAIAIQAQVTLMRDRDAGVEVVGGNLKAAVVYSVELVIETFDDVLLRRQADAATGLSLWHEALAEAEAPAPPVERAAAPIAAPSAYVAPAAVPAAPLPERPPAPAPSAYAAPAVPAAPLPGKPPAPAPSARPLSGPIPTVTFSAATPQGPAPAPRTATPPGLRPLPTATPTPTWGDVAAASQPARRPPGPSAPESIEEDVSLNAGDVILHPRFQRCVVHRVEGSGEFVQVMLRNGRLVRLSLDVLRLTPNGVENGQRIFTATVL
jgi:predicted DNA-binding protein with PD1-like motif